MQTQRCTHPLNPRYELPGHSQKTANMPYLEAEEYGTTNAFASSKPQKTYRKRPVEEKYDIFTGATIDANAPKGAFVLRQMFLEKKFS